MNIPCFSPTLLRYGLCLLGLSMYPIARALAIDTLVVATYNVENLFDPRSDSGKNDQAFTPGGIYGWSWSRLEHKCRQLYRVMSGIGVSTDHPALPTVIGLCEVENAAVLRQLVSSTPLRHVPYRWIHYESPDRRGIDVALLYRPDRFRYAYSRAIPVIFADDTSSRTRDLLYVVGCLSNGDSLHVVQCHWPSKYGGAQQTVARRMAAAQSVSELIEDIHRRDSMPAIMVMGDFNDEAHEPAFEQGLKVTYDGVFQRETQLFLLQPNQKRLGSHKYQGQWSTIDHILVSKALVDPVSRVKLLRKQSDLYAPSFLLMPDRRYLGVRPFRTYHGSRYIGGFSDHLPLFVRLLVSPS